MKRKSLIVGWVACMAAIGCGDSRGESEQAPPSPAQGIVTYKGDPVSKAAVTFISLDGKTLASGMTDGVGSFVLTTYDQNDGVPPGKYKVVVAVDTVEEIEPGVLAPEPEGGFKSPIPLKYADSNTTDILVEVKEGSPNDFKIELK